MPLTKVDAITTALEVTQQEQQEQQAHYPTRT